jgi:catalase
VLVADGVASETLQAVLEPLRGQGVKCELLAPHDGSLQTAGGGQVEADRALVTMSSVLYDAVLVADGADSVSTLSQDGDAVHYVAETYRHAKPIAAIGEGIGLLGRAPLPDDAVPEPANGGVGERHGVLTASSDVDAAAFASALADALTAHRYFERSLEAVPA